MPTDTLTFVLDGDISLDSFTGSMRYFGSLVESLSKELVADTKIEWVVEDLNTGSAIVTIRGISDEPQAVENVVEAYGAVGRYLQNGETIPFSPDVVRSANLLTGVLSEKISSIRFETPNNFFIISKLPVVSSKVGGPRFSLGSVRGKVETLTKRKRLRFTLYDEIFDKAVSCYIQDGEEEKMRQAWGKRVQVDGKVGRDPVNGRPVFVKEIDKITVLEDIPKGDYRKAKGVIPWRPGMENPEIILRRMRDA